MVMRIVYHKDNSNVTGQWSESEVRKNRDRNSLPTVSVLLPVGAVTIVEYFHVGCVVFEINREDRAVFTGTHPIVSCPFSSQLTQINSYRFAEKFSYPSNY